MGIRCAGPWPHRTAPRRVTRFLAVMVLAIICQRVGRLRSEAGVQTIELSADGTRPWQPYGVGLVR